MIYELMFCQSVGNSRQINRVLNRKYIEEAIPSDERLLEILKDFLWNSIVKQNITIPDAILRLRQLWLQPTSPALTEDKLIQFMGVCDFHGFVVYILQRIDVNEAPVPGDKPLVASYYTLLREERVMGPGTPNCAQAYALTEYDPNNVHWADAVFATLSKLTMSEDTADSILYKDLVENYEKLRAIGRVNDCPTFALERYLEGQGIQPNLILEY